MIEVVLHGSLAVGIWLFGIFTAYCLSRAITTAYFHSKAKFIRGLGGIYAVEDEEERKEL